MGSDYSAEEQRQRTVISLEKVLLNSADLAVSWVNGPTSKEEWASE